MTSPENFDDGMTRVADKVDDYILNSLYGTDRFSDMLRDEIGCVDAKAISWKLVAIPIIKKAEEKARQEERQRLKEEIEKIIQPVRGRLNLSSEEVLALLEEKK